MGIVVRAAEPDDYAALRETMSQPEARRGTLQLPLPSLESWKRRIADMPASDHFLVAELDGQVVGNLGLHGVSRSPRRRHAAGIGMAVHDAHCRKGVGSALLSAAVDLADNWLQCTRLELTVFTDNATAIALYERFGFEIEGTHRHFAFRDGAFVDAYAMARVKVTALE